MHSRSQLRQLRGAVLANARRAAKWIRDVFEATFPKRRDQTNANRVYVRNKLRARDLDRAQWRRWFKANRKFQRQMSAMRRAGWRRCPVIGGLPRWAVR